MGLPNVNIVFTPPGWRAELDLFLAEQGLGFNPYLERRRRIARVAALCALSDAELAELGLRRDGIAEFVFSDLLSRRSGRA